MYLKDEERRQGKQNFNEVLGMTRRDFLRAAAVAPALGAFYFGYEALQGNPVRAGLIGSGNEGGVLITESNPDYLRFIAYSDVRPSQQARAMKGEGNPYRIGFENLYGKAEAKKITLYENYHDLLADPDIEMVVIATPLNTHAKIAIDAMEAGKDVLCEKLMAHSIAESKEMARAAERTGRLLAIGHQRHYSVLYAQAQSIVESGVLGVTKHIRALWHRNNTRWDSWKPGIPEEDRQIDLDAWAERWGDEFFPDVERLVRWRLYQESSGGLMAELGSHQLDACGIFLGHARPVAVQGIGGKFYYDDDRTVMDHVYVNYEYPEGRVVSYSSINTNAFEGYGEHVMGSQGNLIVLREQDAMLFKEFEPKTTAISVTATEKGEPTLTSMPSPGYTQEAALAQTSRGASVSRGYREEMEHFAYCVRHRDPQNRPRCGPEVALPDAVIALAANVAMRTGKRIEFQDSWYDIHSPEVPDPRKKDGTLDVGQVA
jgi:predicted dehydrogenase